MIEIKVNTTEDNKHVQEINVESRSKHSGSYGGFVKEMCAVFIALDRTSHEVFRDALNDYLLDKIIDGIKEMDESEGEDE